MHQLKLGAGHEPVVGTGNKATQRGKAHKAFQLAVNGCLVQAQDGLVHTAHAKHTLAVLLASGLELVAPRADLDREHNVDAVFKPRGQQLVGYTVAVKRDDVNAKIVAEVVSLFVVLGTKLVKHGG